MTAVILTAHGTRDPDGQQVVHDLVTAVAHARPDVRVTDAYVDVQTPRLNDAVAQLAPQHGQVIVVPLLFCGGYHVRVDVQRAVEAYPNVTSTGPLGPSRVLAEILASRLQDAGVRPGDPVVMAAAGSSRPDANADARAQARLLAERWGSPVDVGFGSAGTPAVEDAVSANRDRPGVRVAVASLLLGRGHFSTRLEAAGADIVTAPIGADPRLVAEIVSRLAA